MTTEPATGARKLGLMRFVLGSPCFLEIAQATADELVRAMEIIFEMVGVEQKFSVVMENFIELEQEIATRVIRGSYLSGQSHQEFFDDKHAFNRRTINVLTATRLYTDQSMHHVRAMFPDEPDKWAELKAAFSAQYDEKLSCRTMEALRNFAQHRGLPIQGMTLSSRWLDSDKQNRWMEHNAAISVIVSDLESDGDFKRSVLAELKELDAKNGVIDIKQFIREYIQSIATVHELFRSMTDQRVNDAVSTVAAWKAKYLEACPNDDTFTLAVGWVNQNNTRERIAYLSDEQIDQLATLRARTRSTANLAKRFTTTLPLNP